MARGLVVLLLPLLLVMLPLPTVAGPADVEWNDRPSCSWAPRLHTLTATGTVQTDDFFLGPDQDHRRYLICVTAPKGGSTAVAGFRLWQAGIAEGHCEGVVVDLLLSGATWWCDSLRPNHLYRVQWTAPAGSTLQLHGSDHGA